MTTTTLPTGLTALATVPNWVNWNREPRPGETTPTKVPYTPSLAGEPRKAKAGDPTTWGDFATAAAAAEAGRFTGVGFEFHAGEGLLLLDLDHVIDAAGKIAPVARAIMALANSYAEPSPSNTGIRIIARGELPRPLIAEDRQGKKKGGFELYGGAHFGTLTGRPFKSYDQLRAIDAATMVRLFALMWPEDMAPKGERSAPATPPAPVTSDDAALLEKAFAAKGGSDFYARHTGTYLKDDKSDDDFAYLGALRFWTQGDPARMRRLALTSGRVRDKWHSPRGGGDWLDYSITKSLSEPHEVYNPANPHTSTNPNDTSTPADTTHLIAERDATIATLRADVARLGDQVRAAQAALAELTEVREERDFYRQCLDCPDPVVGRALPAIAEELHRSYRAGSPHVQDGREYARLKLERAAEGKPINRSAITTAAERLAAGTPRAVIEVPIERNGREVKTNLQYFACPVEERASVARLGMGLLARTTLQQRHQGRKPPKIMPPAVVAQDAPVRREQRHIEAFYSLRDDTKLATQTTIGAIDYWTPSGEQLTQEAARDWQRAHGAGAVPVESQQHHVAPPRLFVGERKAARSGGETQHTTINDKGVETQQGALPLDTPGQCLIKDCGNPIAVGGYCLAHYDVLRTAHVERYASGGYACAAGDD